eukprot:scaffold2290_cov170-Amphora_coffeaeformis.AAC.24
MRFKANLHAVPIALNSQAKAQTFNFGSEMATEKVCWIDGVYSFSSRLHIHTTVDLPCASHFDFRNEEVNIPKTSSYPIIHINFALIR